MICKDIKFFSPHIHKAYTVKYGYSKHAYNEMTLIAK